MLQRASHLAILSGSASAELKNRMDKESTIAFASIGTMTRKHLRYLWDVVVA